MQPNETAMGLTDAQVEERIKKKQINTAPERITKTTWEIIRDNVFTLFNAINLAIGICIALVKAYSSLFFLAVVALNVLISIIQELRARRMVEELSIVSSPRTTVLRNGKKEDIANESLVLNDIIFLETGKQISTDSVVLDGEIEVDESLLTGESDALIKRIGDTILSGSFVVSGKCCAEVMHVGLDNYAAKIAQKAKKHKPVNSELMNSFRKVTRLTSFFIIPLGIILFCEAFFLRSDLIKDSVVNTSAALLGMLPKGLVLLTSISLAVSVIRLSKKRTLVQELYCIETLAHVDVICLDKTGTLTEGNMRVSNIIPLESNTFREPLEDIMADFIYASDDNNATFLALQQYFPNGAQRPLSSRVPFSSARKWSSVSFENFGTIVVGAPEIICPDFIFSKDILNQQKHGSRVLLVAYTNDIISDSSLPILKPVSLIILTDPIRQDARETLDFFAKENVNVKVISGDHPETVSSVAQLAGVANAHAFVDASLITSKEELEIALQRYTVFGRVSPTQKADMVKLLQKNGHKVAMTGDGVNDVLALREADCSLAMGAGSDAARQISQLVLLDSQFSSMKDVVMEGRRVVNNLTRTAGIFYLKTIYSIILSVVCVIANMKFPFLPIQITLMDLAIEGYPSFFMSFESDNNQIKKAFLPTVFQKALPSAILIVLNIILIALLSPVFGFTPAIETTVMYYVTAANSIMLVFRCSQPFNKLRIFLCSTMTIGFYVATILFKNLLHVEILTGTPLLLFLVLALLSYPAASLIHWIIKKFKKEERTPV